jgi:hypothetical protein
VVRQANVRFILSAIIAVDRGSDDREFVAGVGEPAQRVPQGQSATVARRMGRLGGNDQDSHAARFASGRLAARQFVMNQR